MLSISRHAGVRPSDPKPAAQPLPPQLIGLKDHFKPQGGPHDVLYNDVRNSRKWESHLPVDRNTVYRVVGVTPDEVRSILAHGFSSKQIRYGENHVGKASDIFTTPYPSKSFQVLFNGHVLRPDLPQYVALFEMKRNAPGVKSRVLNDEEIVYRKTDPAQIKRVYFADPTSKSRAFPFKAYSAKDLRRLFDVPEPARGAKRAAAPTARHSADGFVSAR